MSGASTLARRAVAGVMLFVFMFGPVWPISSWLASLMGIRWSGAPLLDQPHGALFFGLFCVLLVAVGVLGRWAAIIVMGRFLSRADVEPMTTLGGPNPLQRIDDALLRRFYRG